MLHGTLFLSDTFRDKRPLFPVEPHSLAEDLCKSFGMEPRLVKLLLSADRTLSSEPLDIQLVIVTDQEFSAMACRTAAEHAYDFIKQMKGVPAGTTVGVWIRSKLCSFSFDGAQTRI